MNIDNLQGEIVSNKKYSEKLYKIEIFSPFICKNASAGQFVNIKCTDYLNTDPLLRRPFSIYEIDKKFNVFSILFLVKGKGTHYLSNKKKGDIIDFIGPLGKAFTPSYFNLADTTKNEYVLIGGGIGIAPLYFFAKELIENGKKVYFIAGFKDQTFFYWQRDIDKILKDYYLFTENGSFGQKGIPTDFIEKNLNYYLNKVIIACGPKKMLSKLQDIFKDLNVDAYVVIEEMIACGIGACLGCVVKIKTKNNDYEYKRVCSDGPIFKLKEVLFNE